MARRQTPNAMRYGCMPGPDLRRGRGIHFWMDSGFGAATDIPGAD